MHIIWVSLAKSIQIKVHYIFGYNGKYDIQNIKGFSDTIKINLILLWKCILNVNIGFLYMSYIRNVRIQRDG